MGQTPTTRSSLLIRIRDARDADAWRQFVDLYAPLVYGFGRKRGLQDCDAADLVQNVLRAVASTAREFRLDPGRGSFRGWLLAVTRNELYKLLNRQRRAPAVATGQSGVQALLEEQPAPEEGEAAWERDYERRLLAWAVKEIRGEFREATWQAFQRTAIKGLGAKQVAEELGMSVGAVYVAKSRVLAQLKEMIQQVREP